LMPVISRRICTDFPDNMHRRWVVAVLGNDTRSP
jgi:hypothetical protein